MLIVGLGNPGKKYEMTRHNIGRRVVEKLAEGVGVEFSRKFLLKARVASALVGDRKVFLALPTTYMNDSGRALSALMRYYKEKEVLVVADDTAIPFGTVRYRNEGSSGGHNGLKSIESVLGKSYARLRIGVGGCPPERLADYVLSPFTKGEENEMQGVLALGEKLIKEWIEGEIPHGKTETTPL